MQRSSQIEPGKGPTLFRDAIARAALSRSKVDRLLILTDGRDSERRDLQRLGEDLKSRDIQLGVRLYGLRKNSRRGIWVYRCRAGAKHGAPGRGTDHPRQHQRPDCRDGAAQDRRRRTHDHRQRKRQRDQNRLRSARGTGAIIDMCAIGLKNKGQHIYSLELPGSDSVAQNNSTSFTVQVLEEKINVLLVEGFPRFEFLKLLKSVLEVDPLVNLVSVCYLPGGGVYVQGTPLHRNPEQGLISSQADLFKYDVVILRDVSRSYFRAGGDTGESRLRNLVEFVTKRGGGLVVLAGQDVYRAGGYEDSHLAEVLPFDLSNQISGEPQFEGMFYVSIPKPSA